MVRALQRSRTNRCISIFTKRFVMRHVLTGWLCGREAPDLPSASWRPRIAGGGILVHTQRPENQGEPWCKFQSKWKDLRTKKADVQERGRTWMSQLKPKASPPLPFRGTGKPCFIVLYLIACHRGCVSYNLKARLFTSKAIMTCFIVKLTLLWWPGTKPTIISEVCLYDSPSPHLRGDAF